MFESFQYFDMIKTMKTEPKQDSFLHETQVDGKGKATLEKKDLDQAIAVVSFIINPEAAKELQIGRAP